MYADFDRQIRAMNMLYQLKELNHLSDMLDRLPKFDDILSKECAELTDIRTEVDKMLATKSCTEEELALFIRVQLADLLSDLIVYCASEARKWNIPLEVTTQVVMASNFSKMGADGKPIINPDNGKFEKGPNYWKPEPAIEHFLTHGNFSLTIKTDETTGTPFVEFLTPLPEEQEELVKQYGESPAEGDKH